ncbi:hypothetical protein J3D55_004600 [Chryseobacterium ginsenosidimutans]|uniref:DUF2807 domain-containing protein n=1 Tax=Chryseobacterium ginsenosidimutans TaxID=687846 RepID=UPI00216A731C|nr:DUF2807 domain-containing protein [Chryseobacterium ginsenosidimutans]MCS3871684.1 hypothetical protein [Chryseobacterium ginsenosidimutans]
MKIILQSMPLQVSVVKGKFNISNNTNVEATSGTNVKVEVNSKSFVFKGSSGSNTNIGGQAGTAIFEISSGAAFKGENFTVNQVEVESTSGGSISVNAVQKLKAKASSGGLIRYKGNPEISSDISKMSGGSLKQID